MPDPIITLPLVLGAAASGAAEALVSRTAERKPGLLQLARSLLQFAQELPATTAEQAVRHAVETARQETLQRIKTGQLDLDATAANDMVALLEHPTFAGAVANQVLFGGLPDFDRLADAYIRRTGQTSARWERLEAPLLDFFDAIKSHLQADPQFGPLVREVERLARLVRLDNTAQIIAEASQQAVQVQERIAQSSERGSASLETLVQIAARQERSGSQAATYQAQTVVSLGQIQGLLATVLEVLGEGRRSTPAQGTAAALSTEETAYLRSLRERCNQLPLALAHDPRAQNPRETTRQVSLANVYIDLQTTSSPRLSQVFDRLGVPTQERPRLRKALQPAGGTPRAAAGLEADEVITGELLRSGRDDFAKHPLKPWANDQETLRTALDRVTAVEALLDKPHLVLLGKPGSGKSTLVNHIAFSLASGLLGDDDDWQKMLGEAVTVPWFPLRIVLRQWSASLPPDAVAGRQRVYEALANTTGLSDHKTLLARLAQTHTLVLFDGLDEVPVPDKETDDTFDRRRIIIDSVQDFIVGHQECRILVTSRVKPYRESDYQLQRLPVFELADLDDARIARFVGLWYDALVSVKRRTREEAIGLRNSLRTALGQRRVLREMAGTPLLLTMLAQVNSRAPLPESRAELYRQCVEQLLWEWETVKRTGPEGATVAPSLDDLLAEANRTCSTSLTRVHIERKLWALTYDAHAVSGRETADLPASGIENSIAELYPRPHTRKAWASRVVDLMVKRGGLLNEIATGHLTFPHRSFQEYLAARGLLEQTDPWAVARERTGQEAWSEVVLLACGELKRAGRFNDAQALIFELAGGAGQTLEDWRRLVVAGQAWLEFDPANAESQMGHQLKADLPGGWCA